jgi:hypothetical protein
VKQCFSLTTKQPQSAYKPQKQPAEQGEYFQPLIFSQTNKLIIAIMAMIEQFR